MRVVNSPRRAFVAMPITLLAIQSAVADVWDNSSGDRQWSRDINWADDNEPTIFDPVGLPTPIPLGLSVITLSTNDVASTLTFNDNYTLFGGTLNLGEDEIIVAPSRTGTINTSQSGGGGRTKSGGPTLNLFPTTFTTFVGPVTITGFSSTIAIRSNGALGDSGNPVNLNNGRLRIDGSVSPNISMTRVITTGP